MLARGCNKRWGIGSGLRSWVLASGCYKMGGVGCRVGCLLRDAIKGGELGQD